jgi:hypothetical protein
MISEDAFRRLSDHFSVFPPFLDVVQEFGKQTSSKSETVSCSRSFRHANVSGTSSIFQSLLHETQSKPLRLVLEFCFLVKIPEEHGREDAAESWSIRQMGVYVQHDAQSGASTVIVLNPSQNFQSRLQDARARTLGPPTLRNILTLVLSCSTTTWSGYLSHLEGHLAQLVGMQMFLERL